MKRHGSRLALAHTTHFPGVGARGGVVEPAVSIREVLEDGAGLPQLDRVSGIVRGVQKRGDLTEGVGVVAIVRGAGLEGKVELVKVPIHQGGAGSGGAEENQTAGRATRRGAAADARGAKRGTTRAERLALDRAGSHTRARPTESASRRHDARTKMPKMTKRRRATLVLTSCGVPN